MDKFLPNIALLKAPSNWFLVAFIMALVAFTFHAIKREQ